MRYEHTPRPNVEHHFHIQNLIETQDKKAKARTEFRDRQKAMEEREDYIRDAKPAALVEFWCQHCKADFIAQTMLEIEIDLSNEKQRIAFYRTKHWCGRWCIRHVTDRDRDPYWFRSRKVRADRRRHHNDVLQPFEEGYNLLYGKPK